MAQKLKRVTINMTRCEFDSLSSNKFIFFYFTKWDKLFILSFKIRLNETTFFKRYILHIFYVQNTREPENLIVTLPYPTFNRILNALLCLATNEKKFDYSIFHSPEWETKTQASRLRWPQWSFDSFKILLKVFQYLNFYLFFFSN